MSAILTHLRRFIVVNDVEGERHEVRAYVTEHAPALAEAFGVSVDAFTAGIAGEHDDARLARRLLGEVKRARADRRDIRGRERARAAQASADGLAAFARWDGDRAEVDVISLLAAALTDRSDALIFTCDAFTVSIPMAAVFEVVRLGRMDLTGFVDADGLHIRWATGGLNFRSKPDPNASNVVVHLPPCTTALAA